LHHPNPMKKQSIICILLLFRLCATAQNKTYYISHTGNDANDGLNISSAWSTFSHVNNINLQPGDKILLEGSQIFTGSIQLDAGDAGTATNPVTISSYGMGLATINAINGAAIYASNAGDIHLNNLILKGDGSDHDGLDIFVTQTTADINNILIDSIEVFGFGKKGCLIGAYGTDKGIKHLRIQHSSFHDNTIAGLETFGEWPSFSNSDFTISYCKFYNNYGQLAPTSKGTGNGIVISGVDGGVIEYCEAYNNGANNRSTGGGPVGIWAYDAKNIVIQYCESHHNKAGLNKDGGGFDLDGGSQYCTIQYCYSHDNEGYGMALVEYGSPNEFTGNIIRYNISQNDARKNSYGAITLYAEDNLHTIKNSEIYNNTLYIDANNLVNGRPSSVNILTQNYSGVNIRNNIFYVTGGVDMMNCEFALPTAEVYFGANNYYSSVSAYDFLWGGSHHTSLEQWEAAAIGQETNAGVAIGISQNPLLMNAGSGNTINPADGGNLHSLLGYSLNPLSPLVDKAITTANMGTHDFFDNALPSSSNYDIGAAEAMPVAVLPLTIISFSGKAKEKEVQLQWTVTDEEYLDRYEIQKSVNGSDFKTIGSVPAKGLKDYKFTDDKFRMANATYRLRYVYLSGKFGISQSITISNSIAKSTRAFYKAGEGAEIDIYCDKNEKALISAYSSGGSLVHRSSYNLPKGYNAIIIKEASNWHSGMYVIEIATANISSIKFVK
jgi:hypothetical protein